jgi:hypothetical protein
MAHSGRGRGDDEESNDMRKIRVTIGASCLMCGLVAWGPSLAHARSHGDSDGAKAEMRREKEDARTYGGATRALDRDIERDDATDAGPRDRVQPDDASDDDAVGRGGAASDDDSDEAHGGRHHAGSADEE